MPDDGQRYELVRGELLVTPAPAFLHQAILTRVFAALLLYLKEHELEGQLLTAPADITLRPDTLVQPDIFVADVAAGFRTGNWTDVTDLFLVAEILSPSTARADRTLKRTAYQEYGIPVYWIVDREQAQIEVWTPDAKAPVIERERLVWRHPALEDECVIDLDRLFDFGEPVA